ncbi:DUF6502 family protein [Sulfitobacter sp. JB4-11]|uniref:DUF6502 family protein n=1 Tax=Sulfitobacter rhodophyticola TaxID=3238304 RepID=UPI00351250F5
MAAQDPFSKSSLFEQAVRRLVRPLVRALIAQGITAPALYRIVKQTYVQVAEEELKDGATDSRISVMTGVHRRDVKEFRALGPGENKAVGQKVSLLASVVGRWISDETFLDAAGNPAPLHRTASDGTGFDALVQAVSRDVRPRTVLDELERQNIITVEDGQVTLLLEGLFGTADMDQKLHFFAHNVGDHMQAAVDNLISDGTPHFERAVFYNYLSDASVDEIEEEARRLSMEALQKVNALASVRQQADKDKETARHRFRFGHFFFRQDETGQRQGKHDEDG